MNLVTKYVKHAWILNSLKPRTLVNEYLRLNPLLCFVAREQYVASFNFNIEKNWLWKHFPIHELVPFLQFLISLLLYIK